MKKMRIKLPKKNNYSRPSGLSSEARILLWTIRICEDFERHNKIKALLNEEIDWEYILQIAIHNHLTTLLYWHLNKVSSDNVPRTFMNNLRNHFNQTTIKNMTMTRELIKLLNLFEEHKISVLPYKGPLLATLLYKNIGLRHFWDLDILVQKDDFDRVTNLLLHHEYKPVGYHPEQININDDEPSINEDYCEYIFYNEKNNIYLEVHWNILPDFAINNLDFSYIWERAVLIPVMNTTIRTLPPEEMLLILCLHAGVKHHWTKLKWICDIALFINRNKEIDWDHFIKMADQLKSKQAVLLGFYLAHVFLGAQMPKKVSEEIKRDAQISDLAGLLRGRLFREDHDLPGFSEWLTYIKEDDSSRRSESLFLRFYEFSRYIRAIMKPGYTDRKKSRFIIMSYFYRLWSKIHKHRVNLIKRIC
jgi:hypothetical protein